MVGDTVGGDTVGGDTVGEDTVGGDTVARETVGGDTMGETPDPCLDGLKPSRLQPHSLIFLR